MLIPDEYVDGRTRGLWLPDGPVSTAEFVAAGHRLFDGPFSWPVMVAREPAIAHNSRLMMEYCSRWRAAFAPHGKTTMSPRLFQLQLDAGAWGITVATPAQVLAARSFGVPRIFLANELLDPRALRWLVAERERDPEFEFMCYVDSTAGVRALADALADVPGDRDFEVVMELGHPDGRTGLRTVEALAELAGTAAAVPRLTVVGVAGYEGNLATMEEVESYLRDLRRALQAIHHLVPADRSPVASAGGSAWFDVVASGLDSDLPDHRDPVRLLRSGAYLVHDDLMYAESTPFNRIAGPGRGLRPALEIWAQVLSRPEPELALVGMGKRDAPYDAGLPVPRWIRRAGGETVPATGLRVTRFNDQHGYLDVPAESPLAPGDLVCFGISHPCTAFDKWRVIPLVDDGYRVVDLIHTYF